MIPLNDTWKQPSYRREYILDGQPEVFWTTAALAAALDRTPQVIRSWERQGVLPPAPFLLDSDSAHGRRRLYSTRLIEKIQFLAYELGMLDNKYAPLPDAFPSGAAKIFAEEIAA